MARKQKKKTQIKSEPQVANKTADNGRMTRGQIIITTIASILIVAIVAVAVVFIVRAITDDGTVDYINDDLSKYITLSEDDYKNIVVSGPFQTFSEVDVQRKINKLLAENKSKTSEYDGLAMTTKPITVGDEVEFVYRGYTVDEDGNEVDFSGGTNLNERTKVEVGSNLIITENTTKSYFIPGFVEQFIGKRPADYESFSMQKSGTVEAGSVIYLTYNATYPDGRSAQKVAERIDLSLDNVDKKYGDGFLAFILGTEEGTEPQKIGEALEKKTFKYGDQGSVAYLDMKIDYATTCESTPLTIDVVFPADYSEKSLRGVEAKFDVYLHTAVVYNTPEFDESFIRETLKVTDADVAEYEGAGIVEKYTALLRKEAQDEVDEINETVIADAIWEVLLEKVEVHSYPEATVEEYYNNYYNEIASIYAQNSTAYEDIDDCAVSYLGLPVGTDWRARLTKTAESVTLEKVVFFYIMQKEDFIPKGDELTALYNEAVQSHLDYYIKLHAEELESLEGEAYDAEILTIKAEMLEYYGDDYFYETVYYTYGTKKMVENLAVVK